MTRRYALLMAALLAVVLAPFPSGPASASCAAPSLEDAGGLVLVRGGTTSVRGTAFVDGCRDTMGCRSTLGCSRCEYDEPPERPTQDVVLELRQDGRTWRLGTADAGTAEDQRLGQVIWSFGLPRGVRPGRAKLVAEGALPVTVRVR